jgi:hypothetical protein
MYRARFGVARSVWSLLDETGSRQPHLIPLLAFDDELTDLPRCGLVVGDAGLVATAGDYAWAVEDLALGLNFCLTFVREVGPDEVISRLGGADPVSIVSARAVLGADEAVAERVDESGQTHHSGLDFVAATRAGDWTMILEPNGYLCTDEEVVRELSAKGEMVSFYFNENTTPRLSWSVDGREMVSFDPGYPQERYGRRPKRLDKLLTDVGFVLNDRDVDGEYDDEFQQRTFALMERMTGIRWDKGFLDSATFRCAGVGGVDSRVTAQPWYAEVREELAAYAEDPQTWNDGSADRWRELGVFDRRVRALGTVGIHLYKADRDLALAVAYAPDELVARMIAWTWDQPFRRAGILDEPWFAPIRDRVRDGRNISPADMRLVEERMDPFLRDARPPYFRDAPERRANDIRSMLVQWDSQGPRVDLCWMFARAEGAGAGSREELYAELRRAFPELGAVEIPPPAPPPPERAAVRRKREARERQEEQWRLANLERTWGGRIPADPRLLDPMVQARTLGLVQHDRDLVDRIAEADAHTQRRMAVWAARYCCTRSGLIERDWVAAAVGALEQAEPPPPSFADFDTALARWWGVPKETLVSRTSVSLGPAEPPRIEPAISAMHAVVMARDDNPLIAAMDNVRNAIELDDTGTVAAAFRRAFDLP